MRIEAKGKLQAVCFGVLAVGALVSFATSHPIGNVLVLVAAAGFVALLVMRPAEVLPDEHGAEFVAKTRSGWRLVALFLLPLIALKVAAIAFFSGH